MAKTTYSALSDIEGKITSISLLFSAVELPAGEINNALEKTILHRHGNFFASFLPHHNFVILAYYNVYSQNRHGLHEENSAIDKFINTSLLYTPNNNTEKAIKPFFAESFTFTTDNNQTVKVIPIDAKKLNFLAPPPGSYAPSCWIQDYFVGLRGTNGETAVLESIMYIAPPNPGNITIADHLAALHDVLLKPCIYPIKGSNVIVGKHYQNKRYAFVHIEHNVQGIEASLKKLLGVETIYWIGKQEEQIEYVQTIKQQWNTHIENEKNRTDANTIRMVLNQMAERLSHLDMYLTLGSLLPNNKQVIFVAKVKSHHVIGTVVNKPEVENFRTAVNMYLDDVCKQIPSDVFQIERIPCVLRVKVIQEDDEPPVQNYILHPYNNCHIEIYKENDEEIRRVYLPDYTSPTNPDPQLERIQQDIENFFKAPNLNFQVRWIKGNFAELSECMGSLHCLSKVLERELPV